MCWKKPLRLRRSFKVRSSSWKSNHIIVEDTKVELPEIDKVEEQDIAMNKSLLADAPKVFGDDFATLYCAWLPICIPVSQLQAYSEDYQGFSKYLDDRQGIGAFYSCPQFYSWQPLRDIPHVRLKISLEQHPHQGSWAYELRCQRPRYHFL